MAFQQILIAHSGAAMGNIEFARVLPLRLTAAQRSRRMTASDRALDWRLEVVEVSRTMKAHLENNQPVPADLTKRMLQLLGEDD